jgi:hypothetical protein
VGAWVEKKALASLVLVAVRRIEEKELQPVTAMNAGIAFQPRLLLALITYCYAQGIYASQDIEATMMRDGFFRLLCGGEFPDWHTIRRFRRFNRDAIARYLAETLRCARRLRFPDPPEPCAAADRRTLGPTRCRTDTNGEPLERLVNERIERALFMDSLALND